MIKEVYGLTVLYRHIYAVKDTILSHFSRPKMTFKTIAKVNKLVAGTPSCTLPPKPFSIVSIKCENISKKANIGLGGGLCMTFNEEFQGQISACL